MTIYKVPFRTVHYFKRNPTSFEDIISGCLSRVREYHFKVWEIYQLEIPGICHCSTNRICSWSSVWTDERSVRTGSAGVERESLSCDTIIIGIHFPRCLARGIHNIVCASNSRQIALFVAFVITIISNEQRYHNSI